MLKTMLSLVVIFCAISISNADLVSQYEFEGSWNNSVAGGLAASARNSAALAADGERGAVANLSDTKWLHVGYDANVDSLGMEMTMMLWVRSTNTNWSANNRILGKGYSWAIQVQNNANAGVAIANGVSNTILTGTAQINDGQWHHIAATFDAVTGQRKLYVDGVLDVEDVVGVPGTPISTWATGRYAIAGRATDANTATTIYRGYVDDVRIYNSVLTAYEISQIFSPTDPCTAKPEMDFNDDCLVDLADFAIFAQEWLECGYWNLNDCD